MAQSAVRRRDSARPHCFSCRCKRGYEFHLEMGKRVVGHNQPEQDRHHLLLALTQKRKVQPRDRLRVHVLTRRAPFHWAKTGSAGETIPQDSRRLRRRDIVTVSQSNSVWLRLRENTARACHFGHTEEERDCSRETNMQVEMERGAGIFYSQFTDPVEYKQRP